MFPKLSEKALTEIRKSLNVHPILLTTSNAYYQPVEAFMSLFDLEKYPITWEQLLEYSDKNFIYTWDDCVVIKLTQQGDDYYCSKVDDGVAFTLKHISRFLDKPTLIVIGEIHGWWEKGEPK